MCAAQGTCALDAENVIRLLTFDAVDKDKAAGAALTQRTARLADLVKVWLPPQLSRAVLLPEALAHMF